MNYYEEHKLNISIIDYENHDINEKNYLIDNALPVGTALLIIAGIMAVSWVSVSLYQTYTQDKQIMYAIELAAKNNRQLEFGTNNGFSGNLNLSRGNKSIGVAGKNANITYVVMRPKNYKAEYIRHPNGHTLTPRMVTALQ